MWVCAGINTDFFLRCYQLLSLLFVRDLYSRHSFHASCRGRIAPELAQKPSRTDTYIY
jgi:hypothetical protein